MGDLELRREQPAVSVHDNNSGSNYLQLAEQAGLLASSSKLIMGWIKRNSAWTLNEFFNVNLYLGPVAGGTPNLWHALGGTSQNVGNTNDNDWATGQTISDDVWTHIALEFMGWTGSTVNRRIWKNGVLGTTSTQAATSSSAQMGLRILGHPGFAAAAFSRCRMAEVAVYSGLTGGQHDAAVADAQTKSVDTLTTTPAFAWRLLSSKTAAAAGGVALTETGTVVLDSADHPSVGGGGGGGSTILLGGML
jgi:hypothetical protein